MTDITRASKWTEADLDLLVKNHIEEHLELDYKASAALAKNTDGTKNEIGKDVSSFANAIGGVIVYGISENKHKPTAIDKGLDPTQVSKEWLENVILSCIHPKIDGVVINPIPLNTASPGCVAYVVSIPQGTTCHQAADHRYYRRYNFQAQPMEDYEVRDVMNCVKHPKLTLEISYHEKTSTPDRRGYDLLVTVVNSGTIRCKDVKVAIAIHQELGPNPSFGYQNRQAQNGDYVGNANPGQYRVLVSYRDFPVIFPTDRVMLTQLPDCGIGYVVNNESFRTLSGYREPVLYWKVFADDAPPQVGSVRFEDLNDF